MTKARRIGFGPPPGNFSGFNQQQRARIEAAYGRRIRDEVWEKIEHVTYPLAFSTPITKAAAPLPVALQKARRLAKAAQSMRVALLAGSPTTTIMPARSLADLYRDHFHHDAAKLSEADVWAFFLRVLEGVISLSTFVEREPPADFPAGYFWGVWITMVANSLKAAGLPVSARKDDGKTSPFILMICALQKELPAESRPQYVTEDAVSQAYHRARALHG